MNNFSLSILSKRFCEIYLRQQRSQLINFYQFDHFATDSSALTHSPIDRQQKNSIFLPYALSFSFSLSHRTDDFDQQVEIVCSKTSRPLWNWSTTSTSTTTLLTLASKTVSVFSCFETWHLTYFYFLLCRRTWILFLIFLLSTTNC